MSADEIVRQVLPELCSGEEALEAAKLLQQAIDAIWEAHGADMAAVINDQELDRLHDYGLHTYDEEEIPF